MNPNLLAPISIPASDHSLLQGVVRQAAADHHPVADFLLGELRRAQIVPLDELPADAVVLNDWVTFRRDWGWPPESRLLVCPEQYRSARLHLSVLSPLGAALIGLRIGGRIPYSSIEGVPHVAMVESLDPPILMRM